jgi:mutator protein MutT
MRASRAYPSRPIVGVGAVIVVHETSVVLVRRVGEPLAGRWSLPGGAVELGETLQVAVAREVREETGLVVDVGPVVDAVDFVDRDASGHVAYHFVIVDFLCRIVRGDVSAGDDVDRAAVAESTALDAYDLTEATRRVIGKAFELYTRWGRRA